MPAALRNVLIIVVLAAVVLIVPGGGTGAAAIWNAVTFVFLGTLLFFGYRLYMEHRLTLYGLGERNRAILYVAAAVVLVTVTATSRLWDSGAGILVWFVLMGSALGAAYAVVAAQRRY